MFSKDNNKRKYTCFVCGVMFESFDGFKDHIVEKHKEGEDYILCPLKRCRAPVRDMRTHFKVIHPKEKLPHTGPLRAMIWRDFSGKGMRKRKPSFKEGWYESKKMSKKFYYRSSYEATVFECLDLLPEVLAFEVEPFKIPYIHKGEQREYTPDILVTFIDDRREVWEVKPSKQTILEINIDKWSAANAACQARGWEFVVITEKGIDKLKKKVQKLLG